LIQPLFPLRKDYFHQNNRSIRRNSSLHPGSLTSLVTRTRELTNHNTIQTIGIYV